jgi:hypothetical protein
MCVCVHSVQFIHVYMSLQCGHLVTQPTDNPQCHTLYGRCLPQFFVVGAFKAGTTSLYKWLRYVGV